MSVIDSLINGMKFNADDDDDMDEDEMDEEGYEDEEPAPRHKVVAPFGRRNNNKAQDNEPEDDFNPNARNAGRSAASTAGRRTGRGAGSMQVRIIKPSSFDQAKQITDTLLSHRTVLLNLEGLDVNTAQRIVDFASGSCYALHGNFMKISHFIIVITPEDVDISGDISMDGEGGLGALGALGALGQASGTDINMGNVNPFTQSLNNPYQ